MWKRVEVLKKHRAVEQSGDRRGEEQTSLNYS